MFNRKVNKKLFISVCVFMGMIACCGCSDSGKSTTPSDAYNSSSTTIPTASIESTSEVASSSVEPTTVDPTKLSNIRFYIVNESNKSRTLVPEFTGPWDRGTDISSFEVYATTDSVVPSGNFKRVWESYWNKYSDTSDYKLGYFLSFDLTSGEKVVKTIKQPNEVFEFRDYLEIYLYDDINQIQGNWYSHLLQEEVDKDTIITSIKLTPGIKVDEIASDITLRVFAYKSEADFNAQGEYTGNISYEIIVKKQK